MKWLLSSALGLALWFCIPSATQAQSSGNPAVNCVCELTPGDNSTECFSTKNGLGNNPWSMSLVTQILRPARSHFSMSLGQLIQEYHGCRCVVTYLGGKSFRVEVGGVTVILDVSEL
jgi:hypothetical protein